MITAASCCSAWRCGASTWAITQGLLARMVADTAPAGLLGTAFGFFNLMSGIAMLLASVLAGLMWDKLGAASTFYSGAAICVLALAVMGWRNATLRA